MSDLATSDPRLGIIFGASSGVGLALARRMACRGPMILAARRETRVEGNASFVTCDVRDYAQVGEVLHAAAGRAVAYVVNCVGVGYYAPLGVDGVREWREIMETNVVGLLCILSNLLARGVVAERFVQVGSLASRQPSTTPGNLAYAASKTAAVPILEDFRRELKSRNVRTRVTLVSPGYIRNTGFGDNFFRASRSAAVDLFAGHPSLTAETVAAEIESILLSAEDLEQQEVVLRPF